MTKRFLTVLAMISIAAMMMLSSCSTGIDWKEFTFSIRIYNETNCTLTVNSIEVGANANEVSYPAETCVKDEYDDLSRLEDGCNKTFNKKVEKDASGTDFSITVKYDTESYTPSSDNPPYFYVNCEYSDGSAVKVPYAGITTNGTIVNYSNTKTVKEVPFEYKGNATLKFVLTESGDYVLVLAK